MTKRKKPSPAPLGSAWVKEVAAWVARRHGIPEADAAQFTLKYIGRAERENFGTGWWLEMLEAQFVTRLGPYRRIRCGGGDAPVAPHPRSG